MKTFITNLLYRIYLPFIIRKEKFVAARMWRQGVKQCMKMYADVGAPRIYLFFDAKHMVWAPMTYEENKKLAPSFKVLRRMGKLHGLSKISCAEDMKRVCYYYTPSKWGALGCQEDNRVRTRKLYKWTVYYLTRLSNPIRKLAEYQSKHPDLPSPYGKYRKSRREVLPTSDDTTTGVGTTLE